MNLRTRYRRLPCHCRLAVVTAAASLVLFAAQAQTASVGSSAVNLEPAVELWNADQLIERGHALLGKAAQGSGSEGVTLTREPTQYTMLTARTRSGGAEMHRRYSDYLIVVEGEGIERTGGTIVEPRDSDGGEVRGSALEGATEHPLHKGDVLFIPAGTPHQAIESSKQSLILFVIKAAVLPEGNQAQPSSTHGPEPGVRKPGKAGDARP